jgi:hypothetical protein
MHTLDRSLNCNQTPNDMKNKMPISIGEADHDDGGNPAKRKEGVSGHEIGKAVVMRGIPADFEKPSLRVFPEHKDVVNATKPAANFVAAELKERLKRQKQADEEFVSLLVPSRDALKQNKQGAARMAALRKAQEAAKSVTIAKPPTIRPAFISLQPGINVIAPPWDFSFFNPNPPNFPFEFANGNVFSNTGLYVATRDQYNGQIADDGGSGSASAGFGFFVSSPVDRTAAFRPFMPYSYSWDIDSTYFFSAHTSGGPAFIVYEAGAPNPSKSVFLNLWSDGTTHYHDGDAQTGYMLDHFDGENNSFPMAAGLTYLVIFLIWGYADCDGLQGNDGFSDLGSVAAFNMTANLDFTVIV